MDVEGDVIETVVEVATRESPVPDNRASTLELFAAFVEKVKSWLGEPTTFGENDPVSRHSAPGITDPFTEQLFTAEFPIAKIVDGEVGDAMGEPEKTSDVFPVFMGARKVGMSIVSLARRRPAVYLG